MRSIFYAPLSLALARRKATPFCDAETASLRVLILTARGEPSERVKGLELGADDYLVKPFSMRELILRIQALLFALGPTPGSSGSGCSSGSIRANLKFESMGVRITFRNRDDFSRNSHGFERGIGSTSRGFPLSRSPQGPDMVRQACLQDLGYHQKLVSGRSPRIHKELHRKTSRPDNAVHRGRAVPLQKSRSDERAAPTFTNLCQSSWTVLASCPWTLAIAALDLLLPGNILHGISEQPPLLVNAQFVEGTFPA